MDLFDLFARITLDASEYEERMNGIVEDAGSKGNKLTTALGTIGKGFAVATGAAATGIGILTKSAVSNYANYEQLVGGVETLFGDSSDAVLDYANNAYKTAGLSANEYMETVTGFSASLLQSLGGDTSKAAKVADMAITDMSDNANKMGTSMSSIQTAYAGFAKQNYTMLDNLKLGYGGTKEEMQRLLEDATAISGIEYDVSSYADIVDAIHVIQTEMGVTGTTAKEASVTISGSTSAVKASWLNLLTGLADSNADINGLIDNVLSNTQTVINNLTPVIETAITSITKALPQVLKQGGEIVLELIKGIVDTVPEIMPAMVEVIDVLVDDIIELLPKLLEGALAIITALADGLVKSLPTLIPAVVELVLSLVEDIVDNLDKIIEVALELIVALAEGIIEALPKLIEKAPVIITKLVGAIIEELPTIIECAIKLIAALAGGLIDALPALLKAGGGVIEALIETVVGYLEKFVSTGKDLIDSIKKGVSEKASTIVNKFKEVFDNVKTAIGDKFDGIKNKMAEKLNGALDKVGEILGKIKDKFSSIFDEAKGIVSTAIETIKGVFNFSWKLPDLKLPHISVNGGEAPYGIAGKGKLPSFNIEWFAKAYDDAYIMNSPTIFGAAGGQLLGGGEGNGSEAIVGTELLANMIDGIVKSNLNSISFNVVMDSGELVGSIASKMDSKLNDMSADYERSVAYR